MKNLAVLVSIFLFLCLSPGFIFAQELDYNDISKTLAFDQARVFNFEGDVEVRRPGWPWEDIKKSMLINKDDEIRIGELSSIELYIDERRDIIFKFDEELQFTISQIQETRPYGFGVRYDAKTKITQVVFMFRKDAWYRRYAEVLIKFLPYTVVYVYDGLVNVDGIIKGEPAFRPVLAKESEMVYVFEGKLPFPPYPFREALEICVEECW